MLLSAVSVLVVAQSISEIPEGLMNSFVFRTCSIWIYLSKFVLYLLHTNYNYVIIQFVTSNLAYFPQQTSTHLLDAVL